MVALEVDVCVVGGGAVGLCAAAQLAACDTSCVVLDHAAIGSGTTSHCAGILHSGARYALVDEEGARQCLRWGQVLTRIAPHCVTGRRDAYYLVADNEAESYASRLLSRCAAIGIPAELRSGAHVCSHERLLDSSVIREAVTVPDFLVDPFALTASYAMLLRELGVTVLASAGSPAFVRHGDAWSILTPTCEVRARVLLVTAGAWSPSVLSRCGVDLDCAYARGTMFVLDKRLCKRVLSICHLPHAGDTLVPSRSVTLLGSSWEPQQTPDPAPVTDGERTEADRPWRSVIRSDVAMGLSRAYAGVRVTVSSSPGTTLEQHRHGSIAPYVYDHCSTHGVPGLCSAFGGKLVTHPLTATLGVEACLARLGVTRQVPDLGALPHPNTPVSRFLGDASMGVTLA